MSLIHQNDQDRGRTIAPTLDNNIEVYEEVQVNNYEQQIDPDDQQDIETKEQQFVIEESEVAEIQDNFEEVKIEESSTVDVNIEEIVYTKDKKVENRIDEDQQIKTEDNKLWDGKSLGISDRKDIGIQDDEVKDENDVPEAPVEIEESSNEIEVAAEVEKSNNEPEMPPKVEEFTEPVTSPESKVLVGTEASPLIGLRPEPAMIVAKIDEEIVEKQDSVLNELKNDFTEEAKQIADYIGLIIEEKVINILSGRYEIASETSSEPENIKTKENTINVPKKQDELIKKRNLRREKSEEVDPRKIVLAFQKEDDDRIKSLRIDILHQGESLSSRLTKRRRIKGVLDHGKRMSLLIPGGISTMSQSFFVGGMEDTFATDNMFNTDQMNSFRIDSNDNQEFKEIFKVLDELEDDSNIFGSMNKSDEDQAKTQTSPTKNTAKNNKDDFEIKKKEAIANIKSTYDEEIKKLKKQGKNKMIKNMIKNIRKERDEAVERVIKAFDDEFASF